MFKRFISVSALFLSALSFNVNAEIVIIGHPELNVGNLDTESIRNLYLGERSSLPNGMPAVPVNHVKGSPDRDQFFSSVLSMNEKSHKRHWKRMQATGTSYKPQEVSSYEALIEEISSTPGSIGYINASEVPATVKVLMKVSAPSEV